MARLPIVAIIGRPNVGKSSLFNGLLGRRQNIVAREAGTTRDAVYGRLELNDRQMWLVDTAGLPSGSDQLELSIREQIEEASAAADALIVVADATVPFTDQDRRMAKLARHSQKPLVLAMNKADKTPGAHPSNYRRLGLEPVILTSAAQRRGLSELLGRLLPKLPVASHPDADLTVALVGRPNTGKSALFNSLTAQRRAIVSDKAGTTRDVNRAIITTQEGRLQLLDTAGIRRRGRQGVGIEHFSALRSLQAIEEADICLLIMDAAEPAVQMDQKIAGLVKDAGRGLALVINKWDSGPGGGKPIGEDASYRRQAWQQALIREFAFVAWAPTAFTSSFKGQTSSQLIDMVWQINRQRQNRISTPTLNRWLKKLVLTKPPAGLKSSHPKLRYMIQEQDNLTNFKLYGPGSRRIHWSYRRYLENELRRAYGFGGWPLKIWFFDQGPDRPV